MFKEISTIFNDKFGSFPEATYFSPGRVNIIGEHTDYNGGQVLPFCINLGISGAVRFRADNIVNIYSVNFPKLDTISFNIDRLDYDVSLEFANYAAGMILELGKRGFLINQGFNLVVASDLPVGGGLSSSAAFLVLVGKILIDKFSLPIDNIELAKIARAVENNHIGVMCGIMDQFVIANGVAGSAMRLHTDTLAYEFIPIKSEDFIFVLVNSNTTRKLTESKYNERQAETRQLLGILQKHVPIDNICDLSPADYRSYERYVSDLTLKRRFLHLVNENHRVGSASFAIMENDISSLGGLLNESHESLRDLYQVSSPLLDRLVVLAREAGSLGSRMIGGGFGGSTLNVVAKKSLHRFINSFTELYRKEFNADPIINLIEIVDGVRKIND